MSAFRVALLGLCLLFNQAQARQDPVPYQRPPLPHLEAWYLRLRERPAFRTAVMTELT